MSKAIEERGGYQLMPEWNTRPANHYLPRVPTDSCGLRQRRLLVQIMPAAAGAGRGRTNSLDAQFERGELHLASLATRIQ